MSNFKNNEPIWINNDDTPEDDTPKKQNNKKPGIFLATPVHSNLSIHYFLSVLSFQNRCFINKTLLNVGINKSSLVTQGRNLCVNDFFKPENNPKTDYLLFIDSDIEFKHETIMKMIDADKDVIAAPYPMKCITWDNIITAVKDQGITDKDTLKTIGCEWPIKADENNNVKLYENGIAEVESVPAGCLLIKRHVFEKMMEEYQHLKINQPTNVNGNNTTHEWLYNFFDTYFDEKTGKYYGEDFNFCRLWKNIGGKVHAIMTENVVHIGDYRYEGVPIHALKKVD
jgi:hypothetical protein